MGNINAEEYSEDVQRRIEELEWQQEEKMDEWADEWMDEWVEEIVGHVESW